MSLDIGSFKGAFKAGVRPNLYKVEIARLGPNFSFLCKGASLPGSQIGRVDVPYMGRTVPIAGNRPPAEDWQVTVLNDTDFFVHRAVMEWHEDINGQKSNLGGATVDDYYSDGIVHQLDRDGAIIRSIKLVDLWPTDVAAIELAFDNNDTFEEFTIGFAYSYWESIV